MWRQCEIYFICGQQSNRKYETLFLIITKCRIRYYLSLIINMKTLNYIHIFWYRIYPVDRIIINDKFSGFIMLHIFSYGKKVQTTVVDNSTNINKTIIHLSPQLMNIKKDWHVTLYFSLVCYTSVSSKYCYIAGLSKRFCV